MSAPEPIRYVLERVEEEVRKLYAHVPETIRLKETELTAEERRLANFIDFVGEGRGTRALAKALEETERKVEGLRDELQGLQASRKSVFRTPPVEWIEERMVGLKDVLERRTEQSALLLRRLLGEIRLEPSRPVEGKPYYMARTSLDTLALLDPPPGVRDTGSNSLRWWRRGESNPRPEMIPRERLQE